ncbi:gamma carbonic anhydrase family protein [Streptomyces qinglanensis]|uniref:Carbonic anhydrase or acetyltransferase, isoleucine patch superfamily n=1 Tax=Streptomyces qinglanensis TaxID=943816 RepID=A0A1H9NZJ1_9ACTN|nr:acyltransferase [Streptomyces qinglanensis]SER41075.1 Carbonic anhydrase or acetyltransferase, isoleucine patch superfamily [Streptomyces qinglanensis]
MSAATQGVRIRHRGDEPQIHPTAYVAPTATLVGDVRVGPRARVMYGAVLDAEGSRIEVGEASVICENAVLRGSAVTGDQPVLVADHVFVGPHATLLGCAVGRCVYVATAATVLQCAQVGAGSVVAVGALVHARTEVPEEYFVPPHNVALDAPVRLLAPGDPGLAEAVRRVGFAQVAFDVDAERTDRISRYEHIAEVRVAEFGAHADDEVLNRG